MSRPFATDAPTFPGDAEGEPVLVPRRPDALVLDAENADRSPPAIVRLLHRVPAGFHGNGRPAH